MRKELNEFSSTRSNNFDLIRFIAALAVIFSHSFDLTAISDKEPLRAFTASELSIGNIAVSVFFITSGFLILQSYQRSKSVRQYFFSRFLRIYPGLIFVILCTIFIIGPLLTSLNLKDYFFNVETVKYLFNITSLKISFHLPGVFSTNPFPRDAVNGSLWSLPYEILCYILIAAAGAFFKKKYLSGLIFLGASGILLTFMPLNILSTYVFYFLCGSFFYHFRNRINLNFWLFLVCVITFPINLKYQTFEIAKVIVNGICMSYIVIYLAALRTPSLHNFSKQGDFSYGLYVWAFPVQQILVYNFPLWGNYINFIVGGLITFVMAYISWHLIEKRAMRLKRYQINELRNPFEKKSKLNYIPKQFLEVEEAG